VGCLGHHVAVVVGRTPELAVQLPRGCRDIGFDNIPDILQEALDQCLGRLDQELAVVLTYNESQEVKTLVYARDVRFLA